jgi:hypothetical protein
MILLLMLVYYHVRTFAFISTYLIVPQFIFWSASNFLCYSLRQGFATYGPLCSFIRPANPVLTVIKNEF